MAWCGPHQRPFFPTLLSVPQVGTDPPFGAPKSRCQERSFRILSKGMWQVQGVGEVERGASGNILVPTTQ